MSENTSERKAPVGLRARGKQLWKNVLSAWEDPGPGPGEVELLVEACRTSDRLEDLDRIIRTSEGKEWERALVESRQQQQTLKYLVVALRIPDKHGVRAGRRPPRGAYRAPSGDAPRVEMESSLERARRVAAQR